MAKEVYLIMENDFEITHSRTCITKHRQHVSHLLCNVIKVSGYVIN